MHKKRYKVVHVATGHSFDDTRIFRKQCLSLHKKGYDVSLIIPHHESFEHEGVSIKAIRPSGARLYRILIAPFAALVSAMRENGHVYHLHDPNLIPIGLLLKLFGKKVIFDSHENYVAEMGSKGWVPQKLRAPLSRVYECIESFSVSRFDAVVTVNDVTFNRFVGVANLNVLIMNYPILGEIKALEDSSKSRDFIWLGMISPIRSCRQLDQAFNSIEANLDVIGTAVDFVPNSNNVNLFGAIDQNAAFSRAKDYLAGIVTYLPEPNSIDAMPNKLFEYMHLGLPVIASNFPHWVKMINEIGCGICVDPESVDEIRDALDWFLKNPGQAKKMGNAGRLAVLDRFSWGSEEIKLLDMYREILS